ncbi:hypothetical protein [Sedimentibacter sp.]|uniref:hypothetical protein n=1 Tax=Sedimentibacter sp. TaxID=1960295 RepID=UPI0028AD123A|nr:hypothetical protein [Sedimentibacter sp.]
MKDTFVFLRTGVSGGTGTLSIRLSESLIKKGYEVLYICQEINDINNAENLKKLGVKIHKWKESKISNNLIQIYGSRKRYIFMTYSLNEFLLVESMKKYIHINNSILYVVHQYGLTKGYGVSNWLKPMLAIFYKRLVKKILNSERVIFMDDFIPSFTKKYYNLECNNMRSLIINLPMVVKKFDSNSVDNKLKLNIFNLLTISRAEFPFKGYLIGLIKEYNKLCEIYNDIELTIITFGQDVERINKEVNSLSREVKEKIHVYGQTSYSKLMNYFNKSHLYIGMGSTILDAANHSTPSLIVSQYTYDCFTSGFFHMQPNLLVAKENSYEGINTYIENVKNMGQKAYKELCIREYRTLSKNYNMNSFFDYLERDNSKSSDMLFSKYELTTYRVFSVIGQCVKLVRKNAIKERNK